MSLERLWRDKSDGELIAAAAQLSDYTEAAQRTIREELRRRHLEGGVETRSTISSREIEKSTFAGNHERVYRFAADQMRAGVPLSGVVAQLVAHGLDSRIAHDLVAEARSRALREAGRRNMVFGALWCIGGFVVTAVTYQAAANVGGGPYVIAWGAILFGAIQFFRGLRQRDVSGGAQ